ncbi:hypothetical protein FHS23_004093 [Prauserella isguenensis]|uniref:DUF2306 domain-containing protein n=1 Tax=Prauserella isguenensis TaxID=1470180 RepID=A0A839S7T7_9PSEU|nr:hypothetical protein [Prauserella isguenensis]MBB3053050.1 hypothetical protein [Prauserella isguenensis]
MWHTVVILIHATAAVAALGLGIAALRFPPLLRAHTASIVIMAAALPIAIALRWAERAPAATVIFAALAVLGVVMIVRAVLAERSARLGRSRAVLSHIGFNLIALVTGFLILPAMRSGLGPVAVVATAVLVPIAGSTALHLFRRRLPTDTAPAE